MRVFIEPDLDALARRAAGCVADVLLATPGAVLALPTGRTPLGLYRELVRMHHENHLDFSAIRVFSLDEYIGVLPTDVRSFHSYLWERFLSRVNVLPANMHLLPPSADANDCGDYETAIREAGGIDLLIAGVGTNGHIAFNEPGSGLDSRTRIVELQESTLAGMRAVFGHDELPTHAVTMGLATILEARKILVLASGQVKRNALAGLLRGPVTTENPVSAVRLHADATVVADRDASLSES
jgi:glucosamine-6-phosphate deaminase